MSPRPSKRNTDTTREAVDLKLDIARLKSAMVVKGLNSARLAEQIGLTRSALSYFQSGKRQPSRSVLAELADKLDVSVDYLLGATDRLNTAETSNPKLARLVELFNALSFEEQDRILEIVSNMGRITPQQDQDASGTDNSGERVPHGKMCLEGLTDSSPQGKK